MHRSLHCLLYSPSVNSKHPQEPQNISSVAVSREARLTATGTRAFNECFRSPIFQQGEIISHLYNMPLVNALCHHFFRICLSLQNAENLTVSFSSSPLAARLKSKSQLDENLLTT